MGKKNRQRVASITITTPSLDVGEVAYVKKELIKSILLSLVAIGAVLAVYFVSNSHY